MTFVESLRTCLKKYMDVSGVAGRPEFWWWFLFVLVGALLLESISSTLALVFNLAVLLPTISVYARRLHDTDRSGWWQLLMLIPIIGVIVVLVWCAQDSKRPTRFA